MWSSNLICNGSAATKRVSDRFSLSKGEGRVRVGAERSRYNPSPLSSPLAQGERRRIFRRISKIRARISPDGRWQRPLQFALKFLPPVWPSEIKCWTEGNDARGIDFGMRHVVMTFDVVEIDRLSDARLLI